MSKVKNQAGSFTDLYEWASSLITAVIAMILIFSFAARTTQVVGTSMLPTLLDRDMLVLSRIGMQPKYGDIVVITKPNIAEETLIKRVIAVEGQEIDIDFEKGVVYVDGVALEEGYTNSPTNLQMDQNFPVRVPEGCVFVMGDNRNGSMDSRATGVGMIDTRYILGRVVWRILPTDRFGKTD